MKRKLELEVNLAKIHANIKELEFKKLLKQEDIERIEEHIKQQKELKETAEQELSKI